LYRAERLLRARKNRPLLLGREQKRIKSNGRNDNASRFYSFSLLLLRELRTFISEKDIVTRVAIPPTGFYEKVIVAGVIRPICNIYICIERGPSSVFRTDGPAPITSNVISKFKPPPGYSILPFKEG